MRALLAIPVLAALLAPLPSYGGVQAEETCMGLAPSIYGSAEEETLVGTEGDDVVITASSRYVETLGGNDTICVTGVTYDVDAGMGDDRVYRGPSSATTGGTTKLGGGSDTFTGLGKGYSVDAGDYADAQAGLPWGTDTIVMGNGYNETTSGSTVGTDVVNTDHITTGSGDDYLNVLGAFPTVDSGAGRDDVFFYAKARSDWVFDNVAGTVTRDGGEPASVRGIEIFRLEQLDWTSLQFIGGPRNETLLALDPDPDNGDPGHPKKDGPFTASMGGGKDYLFVRSDDPGPFDGGQGRDYISISDNIRGRSARFVVDLPAGTYGYPRRTVDVAGIEDVSLHAAQPIMIGDDEDNDFMTYGCGSTLHGGGGDDRLHIDYLVGCRGTLGLVAYGGPGNDRLNGSYIVDRLYGGPGRDRADAGMGHRDVCVAEIEDDCER